MTAARGLADAALGLEARAVRDDHLSLRLWLRLLSLACNTAPRWRALTTWPSCTATHRACA